MSEGRGAPRREGGEQRQRKTPPGTPASAGSHGSRCKERPGGWGQRAAAQKGTQGRRGRAAALGGQGLGSRQEVGAGAEVGAEAWAGAGTGVETGVGEEAGAGAGEGGWGAGTGTGRGRGRAGQGGGGAGLHRAQGSESLRVGSGLYGGPRSRLLACPPLLLALPWQCVSVGEQRPQAHTRR